MKTTLTGAVRAAPDTTSDTTVPNGVSIVEFSRARTTESQTGLMARTISSTGSFATLEGPGTTVAEAVFLYLRASAPVEVELTQGGAPDTVQVVKGSLFMMEFDPAAPLKALRVKGAAKVEYFASGTQ